MKKDSIFNFVINAVMMTLIFMLASGNASAQDINSDDEWEKADDILVSEFEDRSFNVKDFGATINTEAFRMAITLNGQAGNENWWSWAGKDEYGYKEGDPKQHDDKNLPRRRTMVANGLPVDQRKFGENYQFHPIFFQPFELKMS